MMAEPNFLSIHIFVVRAVEDSICDHICLKGSSRATGTVCGGPEGATRGLGKRRVAISPEKVKADYILKRVKSDLSNIGSSQNLDDFLLSIYA